jgi:hypothetical protein
VYIKSEIEGAVGTITMDRRDRFNAFDVEMAQDLRKAALALARDAKVRCPAAAACSRRARTSSTSAPAATRRRSAT